MKRCIEHQHLKPDSKRKSTRRFPAGTRRDQGSLANCWSDTNPLRLRLSASPCAQVIVHGWDVGSRPQTGPLWLNLPTTVTKGHELGISSQLTLSRSRPARQRQRGTARQRRTHTHTHTLKPKMNRHVHMHNEAQNHNQHKPANDSDSKLGSRPTPEARRPPPGVDCLGLCRSALSRLSHFALLQKPEPLTMYRLSKTAPPKLRMEYTHCSENSFRKQGELAKFRPGGVCTFQHIRVPHVLAKLFKIRS